MRRGRRALMLGSSLCRRRGGAFRFAPYIFTWGRALRAGIGYPESFRDTNILSAKLTFFIDTTITIISYLHTSQATLCEPGPHITIGQQCFNPARQGSLLGGLCGRLRRKIHARLRDTYTPSEKIYDTPTLELPLPAITSLLPHAALPCTFSLSVTLQRSCVGRG